MPQPDPTELALTRDASLRDLNDGKITIEMFTRSWRRLERPAERIDVDGPEIVAAHPRQNENAWLLGLVAKREERLRTQRVMGVVGARGIARS